MIVVGRNRRRGIPVYAIFTCIAFMTCYVVYTLTTQTTTWSWTIPFEVNNWGIFTKTDDVISNEYEEIDNDSYDWETGQFVSCPNVLDRMVNGYWQPRNYTKEEMKLANEGMRKTLVDNNVPSNVQRSDLRCGNVHFNAYFRALCEPDGETPCCFNYRCLNKTVEQCKGPWTYDLRQQVQTEFATWTPEDPTCKVVNVTTEERACRVIKNLTIYFIGESLTRQLFVSFLGFLRDGKFDSHVLVDNSTRAMECHKYYRYSPACTDFILKDTTECNGTVRLRYRRLLSSSEAKEMLNQFRELTGVYNSWYIAGFGFHNRFETQPVINDVMLPIFQEMNKSPWPKFIWMATHLPTIFQALTVHRQQPAEILAFNEQLKDFLSKHNVPVMDFTQMTSNALGIDNIHYGKGVNDAKAAVLLNHILEQRHNYTKLEERQVSLTTTQQTATTLQTTITTSTQKTTTQRVPATQSSATQRIPSTSRNASDVTPS